MKHSVVNKEDYLLVVDDSEIKQGDWLYHFIHGIRLFNEQETKNFDSKTYSDKNWKKIIAHLPLNNSPILEGVPLLPPLENDNIHFEDLRNVDVDSFMSGYTKSKEKYKYTEQDVINIIDNISKNWFKCYTEKDKQEHLIKVHQSLQHLKMPIGFELKCYCGECQANKQGVSLNADCKRRFKTTNSQGITQWVGEYIY